MRLRFDGALPSEAVNVTISRSWLDGYELVEVIPAPAAMSTDREHVVLEYGDPPREVRLRLRADGIGFLSGEVEAIGRRLELTTSIYP